MSMTEERLLDDYLQQPLPDGPLPKFCIAHHCTKRNKACAKCAYTAMATHEKAKENEIFYETPKVTRAILLLIEEEMKRQGVGRIEDLKFPDRSTEESLQLEHRLKQAIEKGPVKMVVPSSICAPGYESGLAARQNEEQQNCPYCHGKEGLDAGFHANAVIGKDESGKTSICVETLEQTFYIPIKLCPMCGRKLEELR